MSPFLVTGFDVLLSPGSRFVVPLCDVLAQLHMGECATGRMEPGVRVCAFIYHHPDANHCVCFALMFDSIRVQALPPFEHT